MLEKTATYDFICFTKETKRTDNRHEKRTQTIVMMWTGSFVEVQDNNMQEEYQIHKQTLNVWEMSCSGSLIGHLRMLFGCDFMLLLKRDLIFPKIMPSIMPSIAGVYNSLIGHLRLFFGCHFYAPQKI